MHKRLAVLVLFSLTPVMVGAAPGVTDSGTPSVATTPPSASDQMKEFAKNCAAGAESRTRRDEAASLFSRLGGAEKIHALTKEMVRLHQQNKVVADIVARYNGDDLADKLARYIIAHTGGATPYVGATLAQSHAKLNITDEQFMAGGMDFSQAMKNLGYAENEINDAGCFLGGLHDQIVITNRDDQKP